MSSLGYDTSGSILEGFSIPTRRSSFPSLHPPGRARSGTASTVPRLSVTLVAAYYDGASGSLGVWRCSLKVGATKTTDSGYDTYTTLSYLDITSVPYKELTFKWPQSSWLKVLSVQGCRDPKKENEHSLGGFRTDRRPSSNWKAT